MWIGDRERKDGRKEKVVEAKCRSYGSSKRLNHSPTGRHDQHGKDIRKADDQSIDLQNSEGYPGDCSDKHKTGQYPQDAVAN